ncbi:hypothetical protein PoB_003549100 [Plakobranchus ocellatus]|uniref:Uncharacterized protein n=1 Tax=Plakobranchus ocellatus TaxID=259542 RepID=A0AAV4AQY6_9GAST|nr:hypothetical protein PoB_003549100 [Plakobranchus ocellatus]
MQVTRKSRRESDNSMTIFNNIKCILTNSKISLKTRIRLRMVHSSIRMRMLDPNQGHRTATRGSGDVVHPENHESLMDKEKNNCRSNGHGWIQEIPSQHHQLKFFGHIISSGGLEKLLWRAKICGNKSRRRQSTKFTDILNKFATNEEGTSMSS